MTEGRTAVIPREDKHGYVETEDLATFLGRELRCAVVAVQVSDSDVVLAQVFRDGEQVHDYVSEQAMLVEWFEDDDGRFKQKIDSVVYPG